MWFDKIHISKIDFLTFVSKNKLDVLKFFVYSVFFVYLFSVFQVANSPISQVDYNSAQNSYEYSNETEKDIKQTEFNIWNKNIKKPSITFSFNPDYIKIDKYLMDSLKLNIESKYFKEKIIPINLLIDGTRLDPRWQVVGNKLILSSKISNLKESMKVFVHELWHIIDLRYLSSVWDYDPSENFYNISWLSYQVKKKDAKLDDFVSWYALTNKYEDFAESFCFYIFHNTEFKSRAEKNKNIAKKYFFFSKYIFANNEFQNTYFDNSKILAYNWDTTKIWINLKKYLYYIK